MQIYIKGISLSSESFRKVSGAYHDAASFLVQGSLGELWRAFRNTGLCSVRLATPLASATYYSALAF